MRFSLKSGNIPQAKRFLQKPVFMVATLTGSCGFMLPVATPPNAIAYGSGHVQMGAMIRAGLGLNLICIALIVCYVWLIAF